MSTITIQSLHSGYGKNQILHGVDFAAGDELTVIVGSNGSGKSTMLKSIFGLCDITSGRIMLEERDITGMSTHRITKTGISYMSQTNNVFYDLSIRENLVIASLPDEPPLEDLFELFPALRPSMSKKARDLSGGQRQMLAIAMTLTKKPRVILFDEPTANLSPKNATLVLEKIKEIQRKLGNCIILVEQNVKNALGACDTCYLFSSGNIIYHGEPASLLADEELAKKYLGV